MVWHPNEIVLSSAPARQAATWVPSGVGSFPINGPSVFSGRPIRAFRSRSDIVSSELELYWWVVWRGRYYQCRTHRVENVGILKWMQSRPKPYRIVPVTPKPMEGTILVPLDGPLLGCHLDPLTAPVPCIWHGWSCANFRSWLAHGGISEGGG